MVSPKPQGKINREVWFRRRRYPFCPKCRYNLLGTVIEGLENCPECGREFDPQELPMAPAPEDWTSRDGVRRAAVSLWWRSALSLGVWYGVLSALYRIRLRVSASVSWPLSLLIELALIALVVAAGWAFASIMSWRLSDQVGATGPALTIAASSCYLVSLAGALFLLSVYQPSVSSEFALYAIAGAALGIGLIVHTILLDR